MALRASEAQASALAARAAHDAEAFCADMLDMRRWVRELSSRSLSSVTEGVVHISAEALASELLPMASCAVDNIIKVWDWKDGTCLGTMHGHRETVANLCLTASGTLFSSGIDKMVKVWKPPGSWGEEWHGLQELDLTTAS